jgi:uncharacterized protein (TIGR02996 family)
MHEHQDFLRAVLAEPADDLLRLIYADCLEERRDRRADFIRAQIALDRAGPDDPRRPALEGASRALLKEHQQEWLGPLWGVLDGWEFRRGFVEKVLITPEGFVAHADLIFRSAPVRHVHFFRRPQVRLEAVRGLAESSYLARLATVKLNTDRGLGDAGVELLAGSPHLARLTGLDLSDNWIRNAGAQALARSPYLGQLRALRLGRNLIGREGKRTLHARFGQRVSF